MEKMLNKFVDNLKEIFNERLSSVFVYGSQAVGESKSPASDLNLMVIIKDLKAEDLKLAHRFAIPFTKFKNSLPVFMDKDEWFNSCDVYAIEYSDIKERNKIIYGEDLISELCVDKKDLRLQCEREVKNLLVRLRQTYLGRTADNRAIRELIKSGSKTFTVIFRTILRLSNEEAAASHKEVIKQFATKMENCGIDFDSALFLKIIEFRENTCLVNCTIKNSELEGIIQTLIDTTNSVLKYVDKI